MSLQTVQRCEGTSLHASLPLWEERRAHAGSTAARGSQGVDEVRHLGIAEEEEAQEAQDYSRLCRGERATARATGDSPPSR